MLNEGKVKGLPFIKLSFVFVLFFFDTNIILTKQNAASTKNSQQFLASQVSVFRRNRVTDSNTSKHPFFIFITFTREFCHLGMKVKKNMTIVLFFSLSPMANGSYECDGKSNKLFFFFQRVLRSWLTSNLQYKTRELWGLFAEVRKKWKSRSVSKLLTFFCKNVVLIICQYLKRSQYLQKK